MRIQAREIEPPRLRRMGSFFVDWRVQAVGAGALALGFLALPFTVGPTTPSQPTPTPRPRENTIDLAAIPIIPVMEIPPPMRASLNELLQKNFSLDSALRLSIVDEKYQLGDDTRIYVCTDEAGQPLTGNVNLKEINVRAEPNTRRIPRRMLFRGEPVTSRIKAVVSNWQRRFIDIWRGIENSSGDLEFVAQLHDGKTLIDMPSKEYCTHIDLEPNIPK